MRDTAQQLVHGGVRRSTRGVYDSAQRQYEQFCSQYGLQALPASEHTVLLFVAWLHTKGQKSSTTRVYLAAVRMFHITSGQTYLLENNPRIQLAIRAIEIGQLPLKQKLPITLSILSELYIVVYDKLYDYNVLLIWTAMTLGHFGCLRSGEFTIANVFDSDRHLCRNDVNFYYELPNPYMVVRLKVSKADLKNQGVFITIGCTKQDICAYCSMLKFCLVRDCHSCPTQPLFIYKNGRHLTRQLLVLETKKYITQIGLDPNNYSGHSYRIGGATSAALHGLKDWEIQKLGRWKSNTYLKYIQPSTNYFAKTYNRR